jgi:hypothetical protein
MSILGMKGCLPKLRASGVVLGRLLHPTVPRPTKASPLNSAFHLAFTSYSVAVGISYMSDHFSHLRPQSVLWPFFIETFTYSPSAHLNFLNEIQTCPTTLVPPRNALVHPPLLTLPDLSEPPKSHLLPLKPCPTRNSAPALKN